MFCGVMQRNNTPLQNDPWGGGGAKEVQISNHIWLGGRLAKFQPGQLPDTYGRASQKLQCSDDLLPAKFQTICS